MCVISWMLTKSYVDKFSKNKLILELSLTLSGISMTEDGGCRECSVHGFGFAWGYFKAASLSILTLTHGGIIPGCQPALGGGPKRLTSSTERLSSRVDPRLHSWINRYRQDQAWRDGGHYQLHTATGSVCELKVFMRQLFLFCCLGGDTLWCHKLKVYARVDGIYSLSLCEAAGGHSGLGVGGALYTCELQHVHLYVRHMAG